MEYKEASLLIIINRKGEYLMQDRSVKSKHGEHWGLFGGGFEKGEDSEGCLKRELYEELSMKEFAFEKICEFLYHFKGDSIATNCHIHVCNTDKDDQDFQIGEGIGSRFFTIEALQNLNLACPYDSSSHIYEIAYNKYLKHYEKNI